MDKNYISYADEVGVRVENQGFYGGLEYDDMVKLSNVYDGLVNNCVIFGGKEDCVDCCRGGNITISNSELFAARKNGITIKGGIDGYRIEGVRFYHPAEGHSEIEIGQFSKYDKWPFKESRTVNGIISDVRVETPTGKKSDVRVWVWNADVPKIRQKKGVRVVKVPKWIWLPYFLFRQFCVKYFEK